MQSGRLFFVVISVFLLQNANAQFEVVATSTPLEEYEQYKGEAKLLFFKDGSTALVRFEDKKQFEVIAYDSDYELKFRKKIVPKEDFDFRRYGTTIGIFEANQNISVFYYTYKGMLPILCRVIISPEDGSVISDETIGQLQQFTMKDGYAMAYGNVPMPSFYLRK